MSNFHDKYLHYKQKYINLKNKIQSDDIPRSLNYSFEENTYKQIINNFKSKIVKELNIMQGGNISNQTQVRYIIEGNIGSGKTTLTKKLGEYKNVEIILEAVDKWEIPIGQTNLLTSFYGDMKRNSFLFEIVCLYTTAINYLKPQTEFIRFYERSIWSTINIFVKSLIDDKLLNQLEEYYLLDFIKWIEQMVPKPNGVIYVKCSPCKSLERIQKRKRAGEEGIPLDYLLKIHNFHEEWFTKWENENLMGGNNPPICTIDNNKDDNFNEVINEVFTFIGDTIPDKK
jgi:deoxyadenosine/deoxycytidine kinase